MNRGLLLLLIALNVLLLVECLKCTRSHVKKHGNRIVVSSATSNSDDHVLIIATRPRIPPTTTPRADVRLAIVSMTKDPLNFPTWLAHHHDIGVRRFYIRVEDTPSLRPLLQSEPWNKVVKATFASSKAGRHYHEVIKRQSHHVSSAIVSARADGLTHLMHIDDDELLYCAAGPAALMLELSSTDPSRVDLHLHNVEALMPTSECSNPFTDARVVRHHRGKYCSYANGKSIGLLAHPNLAFHGPHHFNAPPSKAPSHHIPAGVAVIVHFESPTFPRWKAKFEEHVRAHRTQNFADVPFPYYRESYTAARTLMRCEESAGRDCTHATEAALRVWTKWRMQPSHMSIPPTTTFKRPLVLSSGYTLMRMAA